MVKKKEYEVKEMRGGFSHILITLLDSSGQPRPDIPYTIKVGELTYENRTDSKGVIDQKIPYKYEEGTLIIDEQEIQIKIEDLSPIDQLDCVQQLLNNLGFDCGPPNGTMNEETQNALRQFQEWQGITINAEFTEETKDKLKEFFKV